MGLTRITASQILNIDYKQAVRAVSLTNVTLAGGAPNTLDGVSLVANDRILVAGQSTASQNGIYSVQTVGAGSTGTWIRATDANNTGEILSGMIIMVTAGTTYADTQWKLTTNDPITIGSTGLTFVQNYLANSISVGTSNVSVSSNANVTISSNGTANVLTISSTGIVVSGTGSVTGNITGGNLTVGTGNITGGNIVNAGGNGTGNVGSSGSYFNTVFAKATSAQYADLAENYTTDDNYPIGTLLIIGGPKEVTTSGINDHDTRVIGTISDQPAYIMNSGLSSEYVATVALTGRVPCRVLGPVARGDCIVASEIPGLGRTLDPDLWQPGCIVGKALSGYDGNDEGLIEIAIGRY